MAPVTISISATVIRIGVMICAWTSTALLVSGILYFSILSYSLYIVILWSLLYFVIYCYNLFYFVIHCYTLLNFVIHCYAFYLVNISVIVKKSLEQNDGSIIFEMSLKIVLGQLTYFILGYGRWVCSTNFMRFRSVINIVVMSLGTWV